VVALVVWPANEIWDDGQWSAEAMSSTPSTSPSQRSVDDLAREPVDVLADGPQPGGVDDARRACDGVVIVARRC